MSLLVGFITVLVSLEVVSYLIYRSRSFEDVKKIFELILKKRSRLSKGKGDIRTFTLRYAEHPFFAFTLNPEFKNSFGEKIHNKYGFRCNHDFSDINDRATVIYCAGGSSTYCNFIDRNEDTWPHVLEDRLKEVLRGEGLDLRVVNGACSGWTSYQSLIRFSAWVDVLKPKLVIVYHGKNDLVPFIHADPQDPEVFPDYGNVMYSLRLDSLTRKLPKFAKFTYTGKILYARYINTKYANVLAHVYNVKRRWSFKESETALRRIASREWNFVLSRYRSFAALCKARGISILFVTQKVKSDIYKPYMEQLNKDIKSLECRREGCFVYDFDSDISNKEGLLLDSIHFTESGARTYAGVVKDYIIKEIPLFKKEKNGEKIILRDKRTL